MQGLFLAAASYLHDATNPLPKVSAGDDTLKTVLNILLVILGAVAVIVVIIAGITFITSQGEPAKVVKARNAIIYALAGLLIVIFSGAIVNFILVRAG